TRMPEIIKSIAAGRLGLTVVLDNDRKIVGVITNGDLARFLNRLGLDSYSKIAEDLMTTAPVMVEPSSKLSEVEKLMADYKITSVLVQDHQPLIGIVQIYDL